MASLRTPMNQVTTEKDQTPVWVTTIRKTLAIMLEKSSIINSNCTPNTNLNITHTLLVNTLNRGTANTPNNLYVTMSQKSFKAMQVFSTSTNNPIRTAKATSQTIKSRNSSNNCGSSCKSISRIATTAKSTVCSQPKTLEETRGSLQWL